MQDTYHGLQDTDSHVHATTIHKTEGRHVQVGVLIFSQPGKKNLLLGG